MCYRRTGQCTPTNLSQCGRWSVLARVWRSAVVRVSCSGNLFPGERRSLRRQPGRRQAALTFRRPVASASPSRRLPAGLLAAAAATLASRMMMIMMLNDQRTTRRWMGRERDVKILRLTRDVNK